MEFQGHRPGVYTTARGAIIYAGAAHRFAEKAEVLDDENLAGQPHDAAFDIRAGDLIDASLAAVVASYSLVEAGINELFVAHSTVGVNGLDAALAERFFQVWSAGANQLRTMDKANMLTVIANARPIDWGAGNAQRVGLLQGLRNALVHHQPKLVGATGRGSGSSDALEKQLHAEFPVARLWGGTVPFRWNGCLGAGCAKWACSAATGFVEELYSAVGAQISLSRQSLGLSGN